MRAIFDHWVSKDIRRRAKFILKHIEDWKAAREKQALGADADKKTPRPTLEVKENAAKWTPHVELRGRGSHPSRGVLSSMFGKP